MQQLQRLPAADAALLLFLPAMGQSHVLTAQGMPGCVLMRADEP